MKSGLVTALGVVALVVLVLLTFNVEDYGLSQLAQVALTTVALLGLNLLVGYGGQTSLGHGAFYAIGAYTTAVLVTKAGMPHLWTLPIAAVLTFAVGVVFGIPSVRLRGFSLALVTLALAIALPQLLKHFEGLTGGQLGITVSRPDLPGTLTADQFVYLVTVVVGFAVFLGVRNLAKSRTGLAMVATRDNEAAAGAMGVPVARTRVVMFALSAALVGLAGSLSVLLTGYVSPDNFGLTLSINLVAGIVLGGLGTVWGALIGAVYITYMPVYATDISQSAPGIVNGLIIIVFMLFLPNGVVGLLRPVLRRLRSRRPSSAPTSRPPHTAATSTLPEKETTP
ncbi:branched-chain amino acid ABC transporter permease [Actinophytocola oryzae]|uniref:Amino acid/amide ABC transporter membrane protein 2 (HAAT family) n=1 Tax=Actinophytocola oryzae TaxID=502181 RepID=A0A4R7W398_9PSEU|nr:branched-chain amino acid ABC transporter permease [Actinophytocola oryzae]TDV56518.1 amino acid/amide ABC transporter membrane protein 2 (HAAT family) [Actinophytocola oryzae]